MPESHQRYSEQQGWTPDYFLEQATKIGPCTAQYLQQVLQARSFTEQTYNACLGILRLALAYTPQRLEAGCKRALAGHTYNYTTVNNILINNLDTIEVADTDQLVLFSMPEHVNLRGPGSYQ